MGRDTPPLNPGTTYTVRLVLTDPDTGATTSRPITFTTLGTQVKPRIMSPYATNITQTTAFVGYTSNICGYGDYRYNGGTFIAPRSYGCYVDHGITLGRDTNTLKAGTTYTVQFTLTDPVSGQTGRRSLTFTTVGPGPSPDNDTIINDDTPIALTLGEKSIGQYGRNFGTNKHPRRVNYTFTGVGQHILLNFRGYDIDTLGEMSVTVNGKMHKRPRRSANESLSSMNSFVIEGKDVATGDNTITFSHDSVVDDKYGVTDVRVRNLYANPVPLTIGVRNNDKYGYAFEGNSSRIGGVTYSFTNSGQSLILTLRGYDIDARDEAKVFLNDQPIGFLQAGPNNKLAPVSRFVLDSSVLVSGTNYIYVVQKSPGKKYGATAVTLKPLDGPTVSVQVNSRDSQAYGYRYPGSDSTHPQTLPVQFPSMSTAAKIAVRGFDIDDADEVQVLLNGNRIGYLKQTVNNQEGWSSFDIAQSDLANANTLTFIQKKPGFRWGVRDLIIRPR